MIEGSFYIKKLATVHSRMPISDFIFIERLNVAISVSSECSVAKKLDASLFRLFNSLSDTSTEGEDANSVGLLKVCRINPRQGFSFSKVGSRSFNSRVLCCAYKANPSTIAMGSEFGTLHVFSVKLRSSENVVIPEYHLRCHKQRINGIVFDDQSSSLFCYSDDGHLSIHDVEAKAMTECYLIRHLCNEE